MKKELLEFRALLEQCFSDETAHPDFLPRTNPSAGHCCPVAAMVRAHFGGDFVSAKPLGLSHWFNRISTLRGPIDIDLCGDQFGRRKVQIGPACTLYKDTNLRYERELDEETLHRISLFRKKLKNSLT